MVGISGKRIGLQKGGNGLEFILSLFRKLEWEKQYKKYQWIELDAMRNTNDFRPESIESLF